MTIHSTPPFWARWLATFIAGLAVACLVGIVAWAASHLFVPSPTALGAILVLAWIALSGVFALERRKP